MSTPYILLIGDTFPLNPAFDHDPVVFHNGEYVREGWLVPLWPSQGAAVQAAADELSGYIHVDKTGRATRVFGSQYTDKPIDLGKVEAAYADHIWRFRVFTAAGAPDTDWLAFANNPEVL